MPPESDIADSELDRIFSTHTSDASPDRLSRQREFDFIVQNMPTAEIGPFPLHSTEAALYGRALQGDPAAAARLEALLSQARAISGAADTMTLPGLMIAGALPGPGNLLAGMSARYSSEVARTVQEDPQATWGEKLGARTNVLLDALGAVTGMKMPLAAGMLAGPLARGVDLKALEKAIDMLQSQEQLFRITKETKWGRMPYLKSKNPTLGWFTDLGERYNYRVKRPLTSEIRPIEEVIEDRMLAEHYPDLQKAGMVKADLPGETLGSVGFVKEPMSEGGFRKRPVIHMTTTPTYPEALNTYGHERGHLISMFEGLPPGSNFEDILSRVRSREFWKIPAKELNKMLRNPVLKKDLEERIRSLAQYEYEGSLGEMFARASGRQAERTAKGMAQNENDLDNLLLLMGSGGGWLDDSDMGLTKILMRNFVEAVRRGDYGATAKQVLELTPEMMVSNSVKNPLFKLLQGGRGAEKEIKDLQFRNQLTEQSLPDVMSRWYGTEDLLNKLSNFPRPWGELKNAQKKMDLVNAIAHKMLKGHGARSGRIAELTPQEIVRFDKDYWENLVDPTVVQTLADQGIISPQDLEVLNPEKLAGVIGPGKFKLRD